MNLLWLDKDCRTRTVQTTIDKPGLRISSGLKGVTLQLWTKDALMSQVWLDVENARQIVAAFRERFGAALDATKPLGATENIGCDGSTNEA